MFRKIALKLIRFYQHTFSFDHGFLSRFYQNGFCRFTPTCSQYTYDAINRYGIFKGFFMGIWRIIRCNPWSKGGYDPVR